jgi:polyhydroxyalkanoate synthesis regulator phasin
MPEALLMSEGKDVSVDLMHFLGFIKSSFYATLDNIYEIHELSEKVLLEMATSGKTIQNEGEKVIKEFLETSRKSRDDFRQVLEEGFKKLEETLK